MKPKERILRTLRGLEVDHLPSQLDFTPAAAEATAAVLGVKPAEISDALGNHIYECFSLGSVEEYLQNPAILHKAIELGLAWQAPGDHIVYDAWGVGWDTIPDGGWPAINPLADLAVYADYQFPDANHPHLMDEARQAVRLYGETYFVAAAHHTAIFERAWALRGFENHLTDFYDRLDFVEELYERITDYQVELAQNFIAAGVDGAVVGDDYGTQHGMIMKPDLWRRLIKPRLGRIWRTYHEAGVLVIQHSCGDIRPILGDLLEMNLDALHPIQPLAMPIDEVAVQCGESVCYFGGIDTQYLLPFGTPAEIDQAVMRNIQVLGRHRRYIIAPAQAIMPDVPVENVMALIEAIKKYNH